MNPNNYRVCYSRLFVMSRQPAYVQIRIYLVYLLVCLSTIGVVAEDEIPNEKPALQFTRSFYHEGIERSYHVHLPAGFTKNKPSPLVFALHGGGGEGRKFDKSTLGTLSAAADKRGVVLVFPEGVEKHWSDGRNTNSNNETYDDVGFISKIIDTMVIDYGIDPGRVYATGISNGGFMSIRLAMDLSDKIAAVAPVAAQLSKALEGKIPKLPISIMIVNGTKDPLVPFDGGHVRLFRFGRSRGEILSTAATVEYFRLLNRCPETPEKDELPDKDPNDGTTVEVLKYTGCMDGAEVILVKVIGGGHTWPGGLQYLRPWLIGVVCRDFNASELILDFFLRHSR